VSPSLPADACNVNAKAETARKGERVKVVIVSFPFVS
jgi:hypothetical protein